MEIGASRPGQENPKFTAPRYTRKIFFFGVQVRNFYLYVGFDTKWVTYAAKKPAKAPLGLFKGKHTTTLTYYAYYKRVLCLRSLPWPFWTDLVTF